MSAPATFGLIKSPTEDLIVEFSVKVNNLELVPERETIAIKWDKPDVPVANDDLLNYSITVYLHGSTFSHVTTAKTKAAFSSLTSGEYTFSVVARYDGQNGPATNLTQRIQGTKMSKFCIIVQRSNA